jgi:CRISPR-associated protein, csd1 family
MDFFTSLLKTYEKAEEIGLVDQRTGDNDPVLLPLYHDNKIIKKNDFYIEILFDKEGNFYKSRKIDVGENVIFPVTYESSNRTSTKIAPHPIVDSWYYVMSSNLRKEKQKKYLENLDYWISQTENENVKQFLQIIRDFVEKPKSVDLVLTSTFGTDYQLEDEYIDKNGKIQEGSVTFGEKNKKISLKDIKLSFTIVKFDGFKNISVSNFKELHLDFINLVQNYNSIDKGICNISGKEERIIKNHRSPKGVFENAKLISQNSEIAFIGDRFPTKESSNNIIRVGYETSEKIHLMIKYLLENKNSNIWLESSQYLINWFSDDLANKSQLDIVKPEFDSLFEDEEDDMEESHQLIRPNAVNQEIGSSFIKGRKLFGNDATYYIAILTKTSKGRIALKYFRQLQVSQLLKNLENWQDTYSWEARTKLGIYKQKTPNFNEIINAAYGVDRGRYLELDNDSFRSDQYQQLVTALIDGKAIPNSIVKKLEANIKHRQNYPKCWHSLQQVSLAVLHKQYGREFKPMVDHENTNRSYLFGRLLAIFELMETQRYRIEGGNQERITNAERYWNAYTSQPAKLMMNLANKIKPYEETVKLNSRGIYNKLEKEREKIISLLSPLMTNKDINDPLDYQFIFGYYSEKQYFYTKKEKNESEN